MEYDWSSINRRKHFYPAGMTSLVGEEAERLDKVREQVGKFFMTFFVSRQGIRLIFILETTREKFFFCILNTPTDPFPHHRSILKIHWSDMINGMDFYKEQTNNQTDRQTDTL